MGENKLKKKKKKRKKRKKGLTLFDERRSSSMTPVAMFDGDPQTSAALNLLRGETAGGRPVRAQPFVSCLLCPAVGWALDPGTWGLGLVADRQMHQWMDGWMDGGEV